jgi:alpha-glucosidase (family GH31 glycosyl hydrolase)
MSRTTRDFIIAFMCCCAFIHHSATSSPQFQREGSSIIANEVRLQVLTPSLVRMEYSPSKKFIDVSSVVVQKKNWKQATFDAKEKDGWLVLQTKRITLRYRLHSGLFSKDNLSISWMNGNSPASWSPGDSDRNNLGGITTTLDGARKGNLPHIPPGILSTSGYFFLDDSRSPIWDAGNSWIGPRADTGGQDWYFFVYGKDYAHALKEYADLCGSIPMIPRFALGAWVTDLNYEYLPGTDMVDKYHYTDADVKSIVTRLRDAGIPLDVLVLDFAWHNLGWKGSYDWSPIVQDPGKFLAWAHGNGLKVTLNDHPGYGKEPVLSTDDSRASQVRSMFKIPVPNKPTYAIDISKDWKFTLDPDSGGLSRKWYDVSFDDSSWRTFQAPKTWEEQGYPEYDGYAWYRKWITVEKDKSTDSVYAVFGGVNNEYDLFVNGTKVSHHGIRPDYGVQNILTWTYVSPAIKYGQKNLIALRVNDWGGEGGIVAAPVIITDRIPATGIRFNLARKQDAEVFMDILHKPLIDQGVSFWWVDGGQGSCEMDGLNSQMWTNRVFYDYTQRQTKERGFIFSRYGGWGNHRYPSFFTGDTYGQWEVLAYQVPFTAQGGNVLMPYITHDIGGFINKDISYDLYARWVEFGAFSPLLRMHSAYENPKEGNARMPWTYGQKGIDLVKKYFTLRYSLLPYIYSYCRAAHDSALPLLRPLYLEYPELDQAYSHPSEYFFGKEMLVAPVTDSATTKEIYLPPGEWKDYFTGKTSSGGQVISQACPLEAIPVFVRSGSIIVRQPEMDYVDQKPLDLLLVDIFGAASGKFTMYEDDGRTLGYTEGQYATTTISHTPTKNGSATVIIGPVKGSFQGQVAQRAYTVRIRDAAQPRTVQVNNLPLSKEKWSWEKDSAMITISIDKRSIREPLKITVR